MYAVPRRRRLSDGSVAEAMRFDAGGAGRPPPVGGRRAGTRGDAKLFPGKGEGEPWLSSA